MAIRVRNALVASAIAIGGLVAAGCGGGSGQAESPSYEAGNAAGPGFAGPHSGYPLPNNIGCNVGWTITTETENYNENQWLQGCGAGAAHAWGNDG